MYTKLKWKSSDVHNVITLYTMWLNCVDYYFIGIYYTIMLYCIGWQTQCKGKYYVKSNGEEHTLIH